MKLNKNTQIILGVGVVAAIGYFVWKNNQSKDIFANAIGGGGCPCRKVKSTDEYGTNTCAEKDNYNRNIRCNGNIKQVEYFNPSL